MSTEKRAAPGSRPTSSSWGRGWPAWSPPPSWPTPASGWSSLEQEPEASFGGQAWWSFGGLFLVDTPEQRRLRVHDSLELARQDWFGSAGFDRDSDHWPRQWAEAYLQFAAGEKRAWLKEQGIGFFPVVGWAERGGYTATGHGNSVPRFHIVWGTGPASWRRSRAGCARRSTPACSTCASGTGSPSSW